MADVRFSITGLDELIGRLKDASNNLDKEIGAALYRFAEEVMTDSKQNYVPVDTGALMNTGKVMPPETVDGQTTVTLGYGDESVDYALIVHEEMQSRGGNPINWTRPGSGPKYLEIPLKNKQDQLPDRIADAAKKAFGV